MEPQSSKVLLIEDDADLVTLTRRVLAAERDPALPLDSCGTLQEALGYLESQNPDVVLLDLGLPDSAGLETFDKVRAAAPSLPIVVLTVTDDQAIGLEAVRRGAQDYLVKGDTDLKLLPRILQYAIGRKQAEAIVREKARLELMNRILMEREDRVLELKREVNELLRELGREPRYQVEGQGGARYDRGTPEPNTKEAPTPQ